MRDPHCIQPLMMNAVRETYLTSVTRYSQSVDPARQQAEDIGVDQVLQVSQSAIVRVVVERVLLTDA